jgi:hypothetical protein
MNKICSKCGKEKPTLDFYKDSKIKMGLMEFVNNA